jgi:MFS family permease
MAASMFLAPICSSISLFFVNSALLGFTAGAYDAVQIVWVLEIWQKEGPPYVQAQHFFYVLGMLLPSLLFAPFLNKDEDSEENVTTTASSEKPEFKLLTPFVVVGLIVSLAAVIQLLLFIFARYHAPPPEEGRLDAAIVSESNNKNGNSETEDKLPLPKSPVRDYYRIKLIILGAMFLGSYQGMEMSTMQFFAKFAQKDSLGLSDSQASYVLSGLTGAFTAGRGAGIIIVLRVPSQLILCVNLIIIACANVILLAFTNSSRTILWVGAILLGMGFSTTWGGFCSFIERHLLFTNFVGGFMLVFGSVVASIYPLIIGGAIEANPSVLTYTNFFSVFWCIVALAGTSKLVYDRQKKVKGPGHASTGGLFLN